jgi:hypothetical protein
MRVRHWTIRFALYTGFFICISWLSLVGFSRFVLHLDELSARTWVPETQVAQLMRHHGTDVLKITRDEVFIFRNDKWVPVLRRG